MMDILLQVQSHSLPPHAQWEGSQSEVYLGFHQVQEREARPKGEDGRRREQEGLQTLQQLNVNVGVGGGSVF